MYRELSLTLSDMRYRKSGIQKELGGDNQLTKFQRFQSTGFFKKQL